MCLIVVVLINSKVDNRFLRVRFNQGVDVLEVDVNDKLAQDNVIATLRSLYFDAENKNGISLKKEGPGKKKKTSNKERMKITST